MGQSCYIVFERYEGGNVVLAVYSEEEKADAVVAKVGDDKRRWKIIAPFIEG